MADPRARLFLIDTFGLIFRAFYGRARAGAPLMRTSDGRPTEAVYLFVNMLRKFLDTHSPEYLAAVWEGAGPTFRDEIFPEYKANRAETPEDLIAQIPSIRRLLESNRIPVLASDGYEADDLIGTLAAKASREGVSVCIVSSDKDLAQLVGEGVVILNPMKDDLILDVEKVKETMGVEPSQVADFLALKGDSVDNIPGAPGIGDKGARDLIATYGSVEQAIENAGEVKRKTYRESLQQNSEQILLSKRLATIALDAPCEFDLEALRVSEPDQEALAGLYRELEFNSLLSRLAVPRQEPETHYRTMGSAEELETWLETWRGAASGPGEGGESQTGAITTVVITAAGERETLEPEPVAGLCGPAGDAIRLGAELLPAAREFLEDPRQPKRVHDQKSALHAFEKLGIALEGVTEDTMLAGFLLDASRADFSLEKSVARSLGVAADGDPARTADLVRRLGEQLALEIETRKLRDLHENVEMPLAPILARMETAGVLIDPEALGELSRRMEGEIASLSEQIHALAGSAFNINSPKQLAKVLYEDLGLRAPPRRGKTKSLSTASDVLENLSSDHEMPAKVLAYRRLAKLKSTYVDALPALIDPATGRLHTTFNQCGAATGRLSSSSPNLQNIPVRTELGREIRAAFRARPGWNLLAADYSQIELRVLAHMSGDAVLREAFQRGEDIHTRTASEVFGIAPLLVGAEERRRAKAVNFGIVYGQSPFGLAKQLSIPQAEAREYIDAYFERYAGVKRFMEKATGQARRTGYARTLLGRQRPIPDLESTNASVRGFAERTAINSPIQGSAADLIKIAMIEIDRKLGQVSGDAVMLLQVHDELLFEVPENQTAAVAKFVKTEMEQARRLDVPLLAEVKVGKNWRDMKPA